MQFGRGAARLILIFFARLSYDILMIRQHLFFQRILTIDRGMLASAIIAACTLPAKYFLLGLFELDPGTKTGGSTRPYFLKTGWSNVFGIQICRKGGKKEHKKQCFRGFHLSNMRAMFVRRCACSSVPSCSYCQLSQAWPDQEQAKGKIILFLVVNLSLRWTARAPCWVPLSMLQVLFISVGLSLLTLWPPSFCFCICYLFVCVFHSLFNKVVGKIIFV